MNFVDVSEIIDQEKDFSSESYLHDSMFEIKDIEGSEYILPFSEIAYFKKTSSLFLIFLKHPCIYGEEFDCISALESDFVKLKKHYSVWIYFWKNDND
jgi:hypothetical protein